MSKNNKQFEIEMNLEDYEVDSLEKIELNIGQGYLLNVIEMNEGISTGEYGDSEWVSLSNGEQIFFFGSYEASTIKEIIGEAEAPFSIKLARVERTARKSNNNYTIVVGEMEVVG